MVQIFEDRCVYIKYFHNNDFIILSLYIGDMFVLGKDHLKVDMLKKELNKSFDMKNLGPQNYLGNKSFS